MGIEKVLSEYQPGDRVFTYLEDAQNLYLFGGGIYVGEFPLDIPGEPQDENPSLNPKILLDSGKVVWGIECFWGDEHLVDKYVGMRIKEGKEVFPIDIEEFRRLPKYPPTEFGEN